MRELALSSAMDGTSRSGAPAHLRNVLYASHRFLKRLRCALVLPVHVQIVSLHSVLDLTSAPSGGTLDCVPVEVCKVVVLEALDLSVKVGH